MIMKEHATPHCTTDNRGCLLHYTTRCHTHNSLVHSHQRAGGKPCHLHPWLTPTTSGVLTATHHVPWGEVLDLVTCDCH